MGQTCSNQMSECWEPTYPTFSLGEAPRTVAVLPGSTSFLLFRLQGNQRRQLVKDGTAEVLGEIEVSINVQAGNLAHAYMARKSR
jgi:hypothetical protein